MGDISEKILLRISRAIGYHASLRGLGLELKIDNADINNYIATNKGGAAVNSDGTWNMLCVWKEKTSRNDSARLLDEALREVGLKQIAEDHLTQSN